MMDLSKLSDEELLALRAQIASGGGAETAPAAPAAAPPERSFVDQLRRQLGLTLRAGVEGAASFPGMFISPWQRLAGIKTMDERIPELLTSLGVPKPETPTENVVGAGARALASGGTSAVAARAIPAALNAAPALINNVFAQAPLAQTVQAGIGGAAAEGVKQMGGGPWAQIAAGAISPLALSTVPPVAGAVARGARELARPVTRPGAEQIAADVLGSVTQDKTSALQRLDDYLKQRSLGQADVPGSRPTAAAVTQDYGVAGAEQLASRGPANPLFARQQAANNQARLEQLAKLRATQEQLDTYVARRDTATQGLRESAFANATGPVDFGPVGQRILDLAATPAGGREESRKALSWLATRVGKYVDEGRVDAPNAYALHQDIGDLIAGKIKDENGSALRLAGGLANEVKKTLAVQINSVAPGFARYLDAYRRYSQPIDRLEVIINKLGGEDLTRVTNALPVAGEGGLASALSQAKMRNQTAGIERALPVSPRGIPLAPYQRNILGGVNRDLNAETFALRGGKMPGSDTYQNMATANFLNNMLGQNLAQSGIGKAIGGPLSYAMRPFEGRVNDMVTQAMLDPERFAQLLRMARTARPSPTLTGTSEEMQRSLAAALLGTGQRF